ncbi:glyoxalase/bleomycin resistance/dioxygenase family protein [Lysobacter sp. TY2-98]|uniref:VOC family protein n=1 Tax=Lysobacter sp. TY2-98 TaxID=2290922 RepID=UPI000E1FFBE0|nr:VOC family protein [Lysobacter sp. TY2-98]AXK72609.1 glyoxalase/bleomycin resistance/dioxygenase family protein [Lysobacter sp. TY2-98]
MSGPARAGVFIYAKDLERVAAFYEQLLDMRRLHARDEIVVLQSLDLQLLVHAIPERYAADITITTPPVRRENCAIKFFCTVPRLDAAAGIVASGGGTLFPERWDGPGFVACNAMDPQGNVFQLREPADHG